MTDQSPRVTPGADPAKRARLLETAAEEFARVGYERASIDTIAHRAGVAKGTTYLYFMNKAHLFLGVLDAVRERLETAESACSAPDPAGALRAFIQHYLLLADASPDLFRCYTTALFGVNREFQDAALAIFTWQHDQVQLLLARAGPGTAAAGPLDRAPMVVASLLAAALLRGLDSAHDPTTALEEDLLLYGALAEGTHS